jgi:hypothetical protein
MAALFNFLKFTLKALPLRAKRGPPTPPGEAVQKYYLGLFESLEVDMQILEVCESYPEVAVTIQAAGYSWSVFLKFG